MYYFFALIGTSLFILGLHYLLDEGPFSFVRAWALNYVEKGSAKYQLRIQDLKEINRIEITQANKRFIKEEERGFPHGRDHELNLLEGTISFSNKWADSQIKSLQKKNDRVKRIYSLIFKPTLLCPPCMSSFWGTTAFFVIYSFGGLATTSFWAVVPFIVSLTYLNFIGAQLYERI